MRTIFLQTGIAFLSLLGGVVFPVPAVAADEPQAPPASAAQVNQLLGLDLFSEENFWQENVSQVADRLGWKQESRTSNASSYRSYPQRPAEVLGRKAYALSLHGEGGVPAAVSVLFSNKGDVARMVELEPGLSASRAERALEQMKKNYKRIIREDARAIEEELTRVFGPPQWDRTGDSRQTGEQVRRWDWGDTSFLLAAPREEYAVLRIVPSEAFEQKGTKRTSRASLKEELLTRVETRPNGDVVIRDIPMVDQGPKGYCVPATWERALRYMGIPADMNVLAMAASTSVGGGTNIESISSAVASLLRRHGRQLSNSRAKINPVNVSAQIDKGLPILWTMSSLEEMNSEISRRSLERRGVTDWEAWKNKLGESVVHKKWKKDSASAHVCMIVGYNRETGEIAVSDSWGPEYEERWMTFDEAESISFGNWQVIQP